MTVAERDIETIQNVCDAMQAGAEGEELMLSLFADDGVLVEPFSGQPTEHVGKAAIREHYRRMTSAPRPLDFTLRLGQISTDGTKVYADWTCTASVMPAPLTGRDEYTMSDGKIERLEISITGGPSA
jgi:hypothetical protein